MDIQTFWKISYEMRGEGEGDEEEGFEGILVCSSKLYSGWWASDIGRNENYSLSTAAAAVNLLYI